MNDVIEKTEILFRDYYKSLRRTEQQILRDKFMSESGVTYPAFYSKLRKNNFSKLEQKELRELVGYTVFIAF